MKRNANEKIIYELFESPNHLEPAFNNLLSSGVSIDDISLLMNEDVHDRDFKVLERSKTKQGIAAGSIVGGALGGVLGGVVALGSAITGIGLVVVGPALALAAAGGLIGGLIGHGVPEDEAKHLHAELQSGKAMLAVHVYEPKMRATVEEIFRVSRGETIELAS
jgi:uncharacterized membrane protein